MTRTMAMRYVLGTLAALALLLAGCQQQRATATYPNRSIDLIVPWAAGGGSDRVARFVADALQRRLGQPVIVINRTGGSGAVGHSAGALAKPDGYTLTLATFELSTMRSMGISKLTWQDFTPVAQLNADPAAILVRTDAPWKTLPALLDAIRSGPRKLKMSGTSTGGAWDLARTGLLLAAGISPTNAIWAPTQGSAPALVELLGGHVDVVACSVPEAASQIEAKQVRVLAVLSPQRLAEFPEFPTAIEQGITYDAVGWRGIMLPRNTPPEITRALNEKLAEIAASDEFRQFMKKNGFAIVVRDSGAFATFLQEQELKWSGVIRNAGYDRLGQNHDPGPYAMPLLLLVAFVAALAFEAILMRRRPLPRSSQRGEAVTEVARASASDLSSATSAAPGSGVARDALFLLAALVVYIALMPWIGFIGSTALFALVVMWRLGTRWWIAALSSIVIVSAIHLLFAVLFKVQLP